MAIPPSLAQPSVSQAPFEETDPNAINKTILDAKGDLVVASAADTPAKLAVGTDGQVLVADSLATNGVKWATDPTTDIVTTKGDMLVATAADTLVRLPVGANNQVLVADSSTTEGVKWSSETDPNSINKSIIDAKGDIVVGTANDTPARLGVGSDGQYLVADSLTTEGIKWATPNIALGTETTGDYVQSVSGGTGVTVTGGTGEGSTPSVAIGQDVGTGASVAFGGLNVDSGVLYVDATNNRVGVNNITPAYSLDITGDGHFSTDLTVDGTLYANHIHGELAGPIYIHVKNTSGAPITNGTPVYITGTVGSTQQAEVAPADASNSAKMPAIGLADGTIADNAFGHVCILGPLGGQDTGGTWQLGDHVYVASGGGRTRTKPTGASDIVQCMGHVARLNSSTGEIIVNAGSIATAPNSISIPGNIATTAGQFTGSGAGLTNVPAGSLTGTISSTNIGNDSVALGTKTTGDYVQTVSGGTGVTVTGGTGEGSTPSIAIGQAVASTDSPQFAGLTTTGLATLNSLQVTGSASANAITSTTSVTAASLFVDSIEVDTTGATSNQVLQYNGTKFAPATLSTGGIPETLIDAKGDLIVGTAADTAGRLGVGSTGQVLTVDSTTGTGLKWATPAASSSVTVSDTAPTSPSNGDLWFDSTSAATFIRYDSTWVEIGGSSQPAPTDPVPVSFLLMGA
jgi:hypothetical protein